MLIVDFFLFVDLEMILLAITSFYLIENKVIKKNHVSSDILNGAQSLEIFLILNISPES